MLLSITVECLAMSTIYDVAKKANVSAMTVSRVLNDPSKVRPALRERIEAAIVSLGYKQNRAARALVTKTTGIVKIVVTEHLEAQDPYFYTLFAGISSVLGEKTLAQLVVRDSAPHIKSDGMIVMGLKSGQKISFADYPAPVVLFGKGCDDGDWLDVDNTDGLYRATHHLLELGHRDIAFFGFKVDEPFIHERESGYRQAMADAGIEVKPEWVVTELTHDSRSAKAAALRMLRTQRISAVACCSDVIAMGVTQAAKELGLKIPDDLSVTGFDGVGVDLMTDPQLTTMRQPVFDIGRRLAEILVSRIEAKTSGYELIHEEVKTELVVRDTTARV